jgi:hypothetical protein
MRTPARRLLPLAEAWDLGASQRTAKTRESYANDLDGTRDLIPLPVAGQATVVGRGAGSVSSAAKQLPAARRLTIRVGVVGIRSLVREDGRTRRTGRVLAAVRRRGGGHFSFRMLLVLACMSAKTLSSFCPAK